jgi:hypothetical protein
MPSGILERVSLTSSQSISDEQSIDWESPAGLAATDIQARVHAPSFVYRGLGDEHWRGQSCHPIEGSAANEDERVVVMTCGCQASVPWWSLEPRG